MQPSHNKMNGLSLKVCWVLKTTRPAELKLAKVIDALPVHATYELTKML